MQRKHIRRVAASTPPTPQGLIAGHLLRQIREQVGLTQQALAEHLGYDLGHYKSLETGRRALGQAKATTVRAVSRKLLSLRGDPKLIERIPIAIDVDAFISDVLRGNAHPDGHQLAEWVSTREWNDMLGWATTGPPDGSLVPRPRLPAPDRRHFFDNLRIAAEQTRDDEAGGLLRRQVYYLTARDDSPAGRDWLATANRREARHQRGDGWTPGWVTARSLAVARACQGDPEPLRDFIAHRLDRDDACEAANLNYWSYWVGESTTQAVADDFMATDLGKWRGATLLGHLVEGLHATTPYLDLSVHSVWSLLYRRPYLMHDDPDLRERLEQSIRALLDQPPAELGEQARRELENLLLVARTARGPR